MKINLTKSHSPADDGAPYLARLVHSGDRELNVAFATAQQAFDCFAAYCPPGTIVDVNIQPKNPTSPLAN